MGLLQPQRALPLILKAQELDPMSPAINITVAETLADLGRNQEALAQIEHAIEVSPTFAGAYINKSEILAWSFGILDEALWLSEYASELDPESLNACVGIARLFSHLGDDTRAIEKIERCLELGPGFTFAHAESIPIYLVSGDSERALQQARWVHSVQQGWWVPKRLLRDSEIDRGESARARMRYEGFNPEFAEPGILTVGSNNYGAVNDYAYLLLLAGENNRLPQLLLPVLDFLPQISRLGRWGSGIEDVRALALLGETDKALETLEAAVASGWRYSWRMLLALRSLDSIRDDPRFIEQKEIIEADMAAQLASYRSGRQ
jgi:tetratricopeptide (TPR) repeat protein